MSTMPASFWEKQGAKKVLQRFRQIARRVPAYRQVLNEHHIQPADIRSIDDLKKLPVIEKKNYLHKFPIEDLCLDGRLDDKYLIDRSSGYSGKSFFWPRLREEDRDYPQYMNVAYEQFYHIDKKSTLMIVTLGLGTWVGGEKISWATREIAMRRNHPLTVMTPGLNLEEILEIVKFFKGKYDQIVLIGYPPFIKTVIDEGGRRGIDWRGSGLRIGLGGEGYSEEWRDYIAEKTGLPKNDLMGIAGGYGAADLGMSVGREYPITVLIRKLATKNKDIARALFGGDDVPSLCQYNPGTFYIEEENKELLFSCLAGVPLMRYNIHDRGGTISFERAIQILQSFGQDPYKILAGWGYTKQDVWRLPLFYIFGRSDGTVAISGAKIYIENIKAALENPALAESNTGNFKMEEAYDEEQNQFLDIKIELRNGYEPTDKIRDIYRDCIVRTLVQVNSEYAILYQANKGGVIPRISLYKFREGQHFNEQRLKNKYTSNPPIHS